MRVQGVERRRTRRIWGKGESGKRERERERKGERRSGWCAWLFPRESFSASLFSFSFSARLFLFRFFFFESTVLLVLFLTSAVHTKKIGKECFGFVFVFFFREQGFIFHFSTKGKRSNRSLSSLLFSSLSILELQLLLISSSSSWRHRRACTVPQVGKRELAAAVAARRTRAAMQVPPPLFRPSPRSPSPTAASSLATPRSSRACCAPWLVREREKEKKTKREDVLESLTRVNQPQPRPFFPKKKTATSGRPRVRALGRPSAPRLPLPLRLRDPLRRRRLRRGSGRRRDLSPGSYFFSVGGKGDAQRGRRSAAAVARRANGDGIGQEREASPKLEQGSGPAPSSGRRRAAGAGVQRARRSQGAAEEGERERAGDDVGRGGRERPRRRSRPEEGQRRRRRGRGRDRSSSSSSRCSVV